MHVDEIDANDATVRPASTATPPPLAFARFNFLMIAELRERLQRMHWHLARAHASERTAWSHYHKACLELEVLRDQYAIYQAEQHTAMELGRDRSTASARLTTSR